MRKYKYLNLFIVLALLLCTAILFADALEEGTYVVNPNGTGDFTSLEEVIEILTEDGIEGPVVIKLAPGTYDGYVEFNKIRGSSVTNTVTIRSLADAPTAILTRSNANYSDKPILSLLKTQNIIFENLTFKITVEGNGWGVNVRNKSENVIIRGCVFISEAESAKVNEHIVIANSKSDTSVTEGVAGTNLTIEGNSFTNGNVAIYVNGSKDNYLTGIVIRNNKFSNLSQGAIRARYMDAFQFNGNVIEMNPDGNTDSYGMQIWPSQGGFRIMGNRIFKARRYGIEFGWYNYVYGGGELSHKDTGAMAIVANNMIGGGFTYGTTSNETAPSGAIFAAGGIQNVAFYYNSVNVDVQAVQWSKVFGIHITAAQSKDIRLVNNSFAYTGGGLDAVAFYISDKNSIIEMDYNNYYSNSNKFGWYGSEIGNLATLRVVSGKNQNSIVGDPKYLSQFDLHSYAAQLSGVGTPISSITVDIDGDERHATNPCIGADEYTPMFDHDLAVTGLSGATITKVGTPEKYEVVVKNEGRIWQTGYTVYLMDQKTNKTLASLDVDEVIWSEQENTHKLIWIPENKGIHDLYALVSLTGDENHNNDRFPVSPATMRVMVQELTELPTPAVRINANFANQSAVLSWEPIVGAKSYKIYASAEAHATNWPLYTTTTNTFLNIDLGMENLFFKVIASNTTTMLEASDDGDDYFEVNVIETEKK